MNVQNLFADLPPELPAETFDTLLAAGGVRIERICSRGHASPEDGWYDQDTGEWVLLLRGAARLETEGEGLPIELGPGDWIYLPPHRRHRVAWTDPDVTSVWLAVHLPAT